MLIVRRTLFLLLLVIKPITPGFCLRTDPCKAVGPRGYASTGTAAAWEAWGAQAHGGLGLSLGRATSPWGAHAVLCLLCLLQAAWPRGRLLLKSPRSSDERLRGLIRSHHPFVGSLHPLSCPSQSPCPRPLLPMQLQGARRDIAHLRNWGFLDRDQHGFGCHVGEGCGLRVCLALSFAFPRAWLLTCEFCGNLLPWVSTPGRGISLCH